MFSGNSKGKSCFNLSNKSKSIRLLISLVIIIWSIIALGFLVNVISIGGQNLQVIKPMTNSKSSIPMTTSSKLQSIITKPMNEDEFVNHRKLSNINEIITSDKIDMKKLLLMYKRTFWSNYMTMTKYEEAKRLTFVITGDNHMLWLRDSTMQLHVYLPLSLKNNEFRNIIAGLLRQHSFFLKYDPYGTAYYYYNHHYSYMSINNGNIKNHQFGLINLRSYELDNGAYFLWLLHKFYNLHTKYCKDILFLQELQYSIIELLDIWTIELTHMSNSEYRDYGLENNGLGKNIKENIGLLWSCYRPSDDKCKYSYNIPGNFFAALGLKYLSELYTGLNAEIYTKALKLHDGILTGIKNYGTAKVNGNVEVYCYEVDGLGGCNLMDDANAPSLLSLKYFEYNNKEKLYDETIYQNTRTYLLNPNNNEYYFSGKYGAGIGSPHTPTDYIWNMALIIQGLTSETQEEKIQMMNYLLNSDAGTTLMHESFNVNNPNRFTRPWFGWPNSLFAEFAEQFLTDEEINDVYNMDIKARIDDICWTELRENQNGKQRIYACDDEKAVRIIQSIM